MSITNILTPPTTVQISPLFELTAALPPNPQKIFDPKMLHDTSFLRGSQIEIQELLKTLEHLGLRDKLKFSLTIENSTYRITFRYHWRELLELCDKYPDLAPFFYDRSYHDVFNGYMSQKNLKSQLSLSTEVYTEPLIAEANAFLRQNNPDRVQFQPNHVFSDRDLLSQIYEQFNGLCIGDRLLEYRPKKFLIDHFKSLYKFGVRTLFLRDLLYDTMQPCLDAFFKSGEMNPIVEAHLDRMNREIHHTPYNYKTLLHAAREAGIRIVGIDLSSSYETSAIDRIKTARYAAKRIIDFEKGEGKYLIFVKCEDGSRSNEIPGISELTASPFIIVSQRPTEEIQAAVTNFGEEVGFVHFVLYRK